MRERHAHAFGGALADRNLGARRPERVFQRGRIRPHHRDDARHGGDQVASRCDGDRLPVGERMEEFVGAETGGRTRREEDPDDAQAFSGATSQADGSKRLFSFAAHEGSGTPWRTAVISPRIATAISGGVFEPM